MSVLTGRGSRPTSCHYDHQQDNFLSGVHSLDHPVQPAISHPCPRPCTHRPLLAGSTVTCKMCGSFAKLHGDDKRDAGIIFSFQTSKFTGPWATRALGNGKRSNDGLSDPRTVSEKRRRSQNAIDYPDFPGPLPGVAALSPSGHKRRSTFHDDASKLHPAGQVSDAGSLQRNFLHIGRQALFPAESPSPGVASPR